MVVIDPSEEMLQEAKQNPKVDKSIVNDSTGWLKEDNGEKFDRILIQGAIHHF